jgi:hypothetical protein
MEQTTYASRLRYLDADDLDDSVVNFDALDVHGTDGEKLGELDGFLVEPTAGRVLYLVVDSGGWFTSRRFLLPVEHATVDRDAKSLRVNVSKQSLRGYPEFDEDRFGAYSDDEFHAYHRRMGAAWTTNTIAGNTTPSALDANTTYRQPDWWPSNAYRAERLRSISSGAFGRRTAGTVAGAATAAHLSSRDDRPSTPLRAGDTLRTDRTSVLDDRHTHGTVTHSHPGGHEPHTHDRERELVTARDRDDRRRDHDSIHEAGGRDGDDTSPHFGGRAQPGDILGIETGGETTKIGDSAEDENKRRRTAEKDRRD